MKKIKKECRPLYCPLAKTASLMANFCILLIIHNLMSGPKRFGELENALVGISTRTITNKLKILLKNGLIQKTPLANSSSHLVYKLTKAGKGLSSVVKKMQEYGQKFL